MTERITDRLRHHILLVTLADDIESSLVPKIRSIADEVRSRHPDVSVSVEAHPIRSDSYIVAVSCALPDKDRDEPDLLDLEIRFDRLRSEPVISCADVVWGHPSGYLEAELHKRPVGMNESSWADLLDALPRLHAALDAGLHRGRPAE